MKRFAGFLLLTLVVIVCAPRADAQLIFTNNSPCQLLVRGGFSNVGPCHEPYCGTSWQVAPPMSTVVLVGGPCSSIPGPPSYFSKVQVTGIGITETVNLCGVASKSFTGCNMLPSTLTITDPFHAVFN